MKILPFKFIVSLFLILLFAIPAVSATDLFNATPFKGGVANIIMTGTGSTSTTGWVGDEKYSWYATRVATTGSVNFNATSTLNGTQSLDIIITDATGHFTITNVPATDIASLSKYAIPVSPNTAMNVYAWVKTSDAQGTGAYISTTQYDAAGAAGTTSTSSKLTGTNGYTKLGYTVTTDADAAYMVVTLDHAAGAAQVINFNGVTIETAITDNYTGTGGQVKPIIQGVTSTDNIDQSLTRYNTDGVWFRGPADGKYYGYAQELTISKEKFTGISIGLAKVGSPTGTLTLSIRSTPSGNVLASTTRDISTLVNGTYNFSLPAITPSGKYYTVITSSTSGQDNTNYVIWKSYTGSITTGNSLGYAESPYSTWAYLSNYEAQLTTFYAKNTEDVNTCVNGVCMNLISNGTSVGDPTGILPGAIINTHNGTYTWWNNASESDFSSPSSEEIRKLSNSIYSASWGGAATGLRAINGFNMYAHGGYVEYDGAGSIAGNPEQQITVKINSMLPMKSLSVDYMLFTRTAGQYHAFQYSIDNATWYDITNVSIGSPQYNYYSSTITAIEGNTTVYLRQWQPAGTTDEMIGQIRHINATLDTTTTNLTDLEYVNGNNYVNVSSNGRAASNSLDPSLQADVWFYLQKLVPISSFTMTPNPVLAGQTVIFNDTSTNSPVGWDWNFGDGSAHETTQNTTHIYQTPGNYEVNLTVSDGGYNSSVQTETVYGIVHSNFTSTVITGIYPMQLQFTDLSTNATSWLWNFGDGNTSTLQNPSHQFDVCGYMTISLNASNPVSYNTTTKTNYVLNYCGGNITPTPTPCYGTTDGDWCGTQTLFFQDNSTSDIPTYGDLINYPSGSIQDDRNVSIKNTDGPVLIGTYIMPAGSLSGIISLRKGLRVFTSYHYVDSAVGTTQINFTAFQRFVNGTEVVFYSQLTDDIDSLVPAYYTTYRVSTEDLNVSADDRLGIKIYGQTTHSAPITLHFVYQGTTNTSHFVSGFFTCQQAICCAPTFSPTTAEPTAIPGPVINPSASAIVHHDPDIITWIKDNIAWLVLLILILIGYLLARRR